MRNEFLPFHLPDIAEDEIQAVTDILRSGWLTTGPKTKQFEEEFAHYVGSRYAVAVNSCTAALHLALEAVGVTTLNIDPTQIERVMTSKTKAIIPVHFAGHPCEMETILEIAKARKLIVIEDAAHALPTRVQGKMVGTISDISCFSFYATKTITTGEGGMATTENREWAERMRMSGV